MHSGLRVRYLLLMVLPLLAGCAVGMRPAEHMATQPPTPTISGAFLAAPTASRAQRNAVSAPAPQQTVPPADAQPASTPTPDDRVAEIAIYDDALSADWTLEHSWGMRYDLGKPTYVQSGRVAAEVTPIKDYGGLFFSVWPRAKTSYPHDKVLGVSFWLNAGAGSIHDDELAVAVLGSNTYTYWVSGDRSVAATPESSDADSSFSETRLYFLDIKHTIPPDTWVEVVVWLDQLIYDPPYKYVTGVYIKNDQGFFNTFYVDHVSLLVRR